MPFATELQRDLHFAKHGHTVGAADAMQYEMMAEQFMFGPMTLSMRACQRPNGADQLRYNLLNRHFGAACALPVYVKTFYQVPLHTVHRHGGGVEYFAYEC